MAKRDLVDAEPHGALGDSRAGVLRTLRAFGPLTAQEAAERTGLHLNTARFHLDGLVEAGLAERAAEARSQPGRPRTLYHASASEDGVRSYQLLAQILTSLIAGTMPDPTASATQAGHAWGRYLTDRPAPFEQLDSERILDRLTDLLTKIGFQAQTDTDRDPVLIKLVHCPFREIAERHQDIICPLHLGLIQGALAEMNAPITAERLDPLVEPNLCLAHLHHNDHNPEAEGRTPTR
ncbi:helix-turn-helix transcriptional regulator [Actinomadura sp. 9N407]|uniref:helix-turn-helix transcriptional regulator n=1 Tax=Actinomadura sp. 9N407 TaxID=3375154 RepID=UPI0037A13040